MHGKWVVYKRKKALDHKGPKHSQWQEKGSLKEKFFGTRGKKRDAHAELGVGHLHTRQEGCHSSPRSEGVSISDQTDHKRSPKPSRNKLTPRELGCGTPLLGKGISANRKEKTEGTAQQTRNTATESARRPTVGEEKRDYIHPHPRAKKRRVKCSTQKAGAGPGSSIGESTQ